MHNQADVSSGRLATRAERAAAILAFDFPCFERENTKVYLIFS